jgi:hypothetical protein
MQLNLHFQIRQMSPGHSDFIGRSAGRAPERGKDRDWK